MTALLLFPLLAACSVWFAGRRNPAHDPRLTTLAFGLLAALPLLLLMPKVPLLPAASPAIGEAPVIPGWLLPALWLAGFAVALVRLFLSALGLARWFKRSRPLGEAGERVELRELDGLRGPVAAGVFRKVIFVPPGWNLLDASTRQAVLLHELAHHRRRDPLVRWLAAFGVAVHWFNPLVHWMKRRLATQCEHACDEHVLAAGLSSSDYAEVLCRFASHRRLPVTGLAMAEMSSLESRVRHLMSPRQTRGFFTLAALAGLTVWGAILLPLLGRKAPGANVPDRAEVELRLSADPFPADTP